MEKPKIETKREKYYDYHNVINYIEEKYNINVRDYLNSHNHFSNWLKLVGEKQPSYINVSSHNIYTFKDKNISKKEYDKKIKENQEQYQRYNKWCIKNPIPEYLDFWHWLLEQFDDEIQNSLIMSFDIKEHMDSDDTPKWVKEILTLIRKEFEPMIIDKWGEYYDFLMKW